MLGEHGLPQHGKGFPASSAMCLQMFSCQGCLHTSSVCSALQCHLEAFPADLAELMVCCRCFTREQMGNTETKEVCFSLHISFCSQ